MMPLTPVIARVPRHSAQVARLVEHCRKLDGTELTVIDIPQPEPFQFLPENRMACLQSGSLHFVADKLRRPFLWLEPDSIPCGSGWLETLTAEYWQSGREFMLSEDSEPPGDMAGGIGAYGSDTRWLIPQMFRRDAWDLWMIKHLSPLIHRTPLIQHTHGIYRNGIRIGDHTDFLPLLRPEACVFHADKSQSLITHPVTTVAPRHKVQTWFHSGDLGDIIAALPAVRQSGGGDLVIGQHPGSGTRETMTQARFDLIAPLLRQQPYLQEVRFGGACGTQISTFRRKSSRREGENLAQWQARHLGIERLDLSPWLTVDAQVKSGVLMARSSRYWNPSFQWRKLREQHPQAVFIGTADEHRQFQQYTTREIRWQRTADFLELARLIAGCELFIGNQSAPFWIAAGLGVPILQETCREHPDSVVARENAKYI